MEGRVPIIPLTVLASGEGTTLQAILDAADRGEIPYRVNCVVVDRPDTGAARRARHADVPVRLVDRKTWARGELSARVDAAVPAETRIVVLAGFLSIVTEPLLSRFHRAMINLHPSLLPKFGGAGMYGRRVHEAVIAAGERESGCTVHYVDAGTDTGEMILHRRIPVLPDDTPESLQVRLQPVERRALLDALVTLAPILR